MVRHSTFGANLHHDAIEAEANLTTTEDLKPELRQWVKQSYLKQKVAILVSDMSGFTRLTRQYGIIHFASIIIRMRQLCLPILHHYGAVLVTTEADNFIVVFPTAQGALMAAFKMQQTVAAYNQALPASKSHFALTLNGVGVDYGWGPLVDKDEKLHGETFAHAYAIGEDLCDKGEVVLSGNVKSAVENLPEFRKALFVAKDLEDDDAKNVANATGGLYVLTLEDGGNFGVAGVDDSRFLHGDLLQFAFRHGPTLTEADLKRHDDMIKGKYQQDKVVLMFEFEYENATETQQRIALKFGCLDLFKNIFQKYNAVGAEDVLYIFDDPVSAVLTAVTCRKLLNEENRKHEGNGDKPMVTIKGFGVHIGSMLFVPGTDIHWGDPVNTSSKLGQDLAEGGEIIISNETYEKVKSDPRIGCLTLEPAELERSKVVFKCFKVWDKPRQGSEGSVVTYAQPLLRIPSCPLAPSAPSPPSSPNMKGRNGVPYQPWWVHLTNGFCCKQQGGEAQQTTIQATNGYANR
jgi:class 3 adenylate cyclase